MAIIKETIPVHKHFLIVDSPIPFTLVANNGTDEVYRMAGAWRIDLWKILTKDYFKQYPVFTLDLVYDDTNLGGQTITIRQSDIDLGEGIAGINGQDVHITNFDEVTDGKTIKDIYDYLPQLKKNLISVTKTNLSDFKTIITNLHSNDNNYFNDNYIPYLYMSYSKRRGISTPLTYNRKVITVINGNFHYYEETSNGIVNKFGYAVSIYISSDNIILKYFNNSTTNMYNDTIDLTTLDGSTTTFNGTIKYFE